MSLVSPAAQKLERSRVASISEENGWWLKGRLLSHDRPFFEISFEDYEKFDKYPKFLLGTGVPVTYLGLFLGKTCTAEFQLGQWPRKPRDDKVREQILSIASVLHGMRPFQVARRSFIHLTPGAACTDITTHTRVF